MKNLFDKFEKIILILVVFCFSFLVVIQFINYENDFSINASILEEDGFEHTSIDKGVIILKNIDEQYKDIKVLVNGKVVADFKKSNEIEITVYDNDLIEIDGTTYDDQISIKIVGVSENISSPELDTVITTSKSIEVLGKVKIK